MAAITVQDVGAGGLGEVTFANSTTSDTVTPGLRVGGFDVLPVILLVANGDADPHTVTVGENDPVEIAAGDTAAFPIYSEGVGDNSVTVASDVATAQTVAAIRLTGR